MTNSYTRAPRPSMRPIPATWFRQSARQPCITQIILQSFNPTSLVLETYLNPSYSQISHYRTCTAHPAFQPAFPLSNSAPTRSALPTLASHEYQVPPPLPHTFYPTLTTDLSRVRTLTGKEIELDIEPEYKVSRIKERVEEKEGIPPVQQRLIFGGKQM